MQEDLKIAGAWCENNGMELNALKCKVMNITRAHKTHFLKIGKNCLPVKSF
jgi:hypothetical protein